MLRLYRLTKIRAKEISIESKDYLLLGHLDTLYAFLNSAEAIDSTFILL